ncbi:MAG: MGMT family protein [Acidobacteriota bacterium]
MARQTSHPRPARHAGPKDFTARVLSVVRRIPPGRVATYGDVAALAGRPRASRAVGNIMRSCGRLDLPCHRVIAAGGRLGGYGGDEMLKRSLLTAEGIVVSRSRVRAFDAIRWRTPRDSRPAKPVSHRRRRLMKR